MAKKLALSHPCRPGGDLYLANPKYQEWVKSLNKREDMLDTIGIPYMSKNPLPLIPLIDFGSQYTHLLKKALENLGHNIRLMTFEEYEQLNVEADAIVLSGGPKSLYEDRDYKNTKLYKHMIDNKPILGVCYGFQILASMLDCKVVQGDTGEYGKTTVHSTAFKEAQTTVWMSHRDTIIPNEKISVSFETENGYPAAFESKDYRVVAFQYHPEVKHTELGMEHLKNSLNRAKFPQPTYGLVLEASEVPEDLETALCAFSGGVDSLVAAVHTYKRIGDRLHCLYIDTGMMRPQDRLNIEEMRVALGLQIEILDAKTTFLDALKGVTEPEAKRKAIGETFIRVFEEYKAKNGSKYTHLVQGTIFPDVIESSDTNGQAEVIKSHHNVGGLPEKMDMKLYEPLREFYKDDVRMYGLKMGIPPQMIYRHPFPGPGLGIRILEEINEETLRIAKQSDQILFEILEKTSNYSNTWQAFTVVLPVKTVGVKGDSRTYERVVAVRMVDSVDGMTATFSRIGFDVLEKISSRIMNEVQGVNRVVYDISNKPCATIEWE